MLASDALAQLNHRKMADIGDEQLGYPPYALGTGSEMGYRAAWRSVADRAGGVSMTVARF